MDRKAGHKRQKVSGSENIVSPGGLPVIGRKTSGLRGGSIKASVITQVSKRAIIEESQNEVKIMSVTIQITQNQSRSRWPHGHILPDQINEVINTRSSNNIIVAIGPTIYIVDNQ